MNVKYKVNETLDDKWSTRIRKVLIQSNKAIGLLTIRPASNFSLISIGFYYLKGSSKIYLLVSSNALATEIINLSDARDKAGVLKSASLLRGHGYFPSFHHRFL